MCPGLDASPPASTHELTIPNDVSIPLYPPVLTKPVPMIPSALDPQLNLFLPPFHLILTEYPQKMQPRKEHWGHQGETEVTARAGQESVATAAASWLRDLENRVVQKGSGVIGPTLEVRVLCDMKLVGCPRFSTFLTLVPSIAHALGNTSRGLRPTVCALHTLHAEQGPGEVGAVSESMNHPQTVRPERSMSLRAAARIAEGAVSV